MIWMKDNVKIAVTFRHRDTITKFLKKNLKHVKVMAKSCVCTIKSVPILIIIIMIHVILFINIINCCAFLYICFPSACLRHCYYYTDRFGHLQSVIQIRLFETMHTMTIDMKNDKIH